MISFNNEQIFIVTGASSGIGKCVAETLNALGATVVAIARREDKLIELKENAKFPENIHIEIKDLSENIEELPDYVKSLKVKYGKFSGMAYCAGISGIHPIQVVTMDILEKMFRISYYAPVFLMKGLVDRRNNIGRGASFVFISSIGAINCDPGMSAYAGAKAALAASMESISREVSKQGIRVNCVSPSLINTDMAEDIARQYAEGKYPFGIGEVEDVANMIVFLLSDKAKWITSQNYIIDCGSS